jgi:GNAT superfamily N-acetyltransferase
MSAATATSVTRTRASHARSVAIVPLQASMANAVAHMTFPAYRHLLSLAANVRHPHDGDTRGIQPIGVVAILDGRPVGLALAEVPVDRQADADRAPELLSLFTDASVRRQGLGVALVAGIERAVAARREARLDAVYMTGKADVTAIERIFAARGWHPPAVRTVTLRFTVDEAARMPWFGRVPLRDGDFEVFPWSDLRASEREALVRSHLERPWILKGLEFWRHDHAGFDPVSSLGLRYRGDIVGWTINHRLAADTTRISGAFVRDDLMRRGRLMALWTESISRMRAGGVRWITSITPIQLEPMIDFLSRRVAPWATFHGETRGTHVILTQPSRHTAAPTHTAHAI